MKPGLCTPHAERALRVTWEVIGTDGGHRSVLDDVVAAGKAAQEWRRGTRSSFETLGRHINRLLDTYHALPEAPLLPRRADGAAY